MAKFERGMYSDCTENDQVVSTYRFAKNIVDSNILEVKENEDGFLALSLVAPYTINGIIPVERDFVIFSTNNTDSEIGLATNTGSLTYTYSTVYNNSDLAFNTANPIQGEFRREVNNNRVITFFDIVNTPRILNIDNLSGITDVEDLSLFQRPINPIINNGQVLNNGGALTTGAIIPITRYKNRDGSSTNWYIHDKVYFIIDESTTAAFEQVDGCLGGITTNKSLQIDLIESDTRFETITVGYIKSTNNIITAYRLYDSANASPLTLAITGTETNIEIPIAEVLTSTTSYNNVKAMTQLSGRLFLANLTSDPIPNLQAVACGIKANYETDLINVISTTNSHKSNLSPALMPGEVYALYLGVELKQGGYAYYHIPGRPAVAAETSTVTNEGMTYKTFQVDDTANAVGAQTNMGYWENSNELYPNSTGFNGSVTGEDLRNTPVRHHRIPTLNEIRSQHYPIDNSLGIYTLPRVRLNITEVNIPAEVQSKIRRWKIFYAKKTTTNSLVIGSDLLQFGVGTEQDSNIRWGTGGNWWVDAQTGGTDIWRDFNRPSVDTLRGHCLDFLLNVESATPTYAWFFYKLRRINLNAQYTGFRSSGGLLTQAKENYTENLSGVIDYTVPIQTIKTGVGFYKSLSNFKYLNPNSLDGKFKTQYTEGVFVGDINTPGSSFNSINLEALVRTRSQGSTYVGPPMRTAAPYADIDALNGTEDTMYMQYYRLLTNVHSSVFSQDVIPLDGYASPSESNMSQITGGDTFLCYMSYLAAAPNSSNPDEDVPTSDPAKGIRFWKAYIGYSRNNLNYRHQTTGDISTIYYPKTDPRTLWVPSITTGAAGAHNITFSLTDGVNNIQYNQDYSTENEFITGVIVNPDVITETEFPNTIIFSPVQNEETKEFSWRTFLSGDRYVMPKNKGEIINLRGYRNNELLIHHKYSLFRTRTDAKAGVTGSDIFYKSANLFDLPPEELIIGSAGYGGTRNRFACSLNKMGYFFPDDLQGKIFHYDGDALKEISSNGLRNFFRDFMFIPTNTDNPFTDNGYTIQYDEKVNRLLVTKKTTNNKSWTASFSPAKNYWISYHDFIPDFMFTTVTGSLIGIKNNEFFLMNPATQEVQVINTAKGVYFDSTKNSSYIDVVHNEEAAFDKEYTALKWVTEVYPESIVEDQLSSALDYTSTCTHVTMRTPQHCTGRVTLLNQDSYNSVYSSNVRNVNRSWFFNAIRDLATQTGFVYGFYNNYGIDTTKLNISMPWYDQRRFIDKYVICRFEYDNQVNNRFLFLDSKVEYEKVTK